MTNTTVPQSRAAVHMSRTGRAALAYANLFGWSVLPTHSIVGGKCTCGKPDCPSPGKHPITQNGVKDATRDLGVIRVWWHRWPLANVGIATGAASGFFAVDIDGAEGRDSLAELERQHGKLPATVESLTGSGGSHLLFKCPPFAVGNRVALARGLDLRGDAGYVVAPPSEHTSGRSYCWEVSSRPGEVPLAEAPEWLLNLIRPAAGAQQAKPPDFWRALAEGGAERGSRNAAVAKLTGLLLRRGIDPWVALSLVEAWNTAKNRPPLSQSEVRQTVDSIAAAELRRRCQDE